jgi:putative oxidoreductase
MDDTEAKLNRYQPRMLSILRIMFGLLFLQHGLVKWFGFPAANPNFANIQLLSLIGIAGVIEIVGGVLVTAGLFTRFAAFIMSGEMAVSYFLNRTGAGKAFAPLLNGGNLEVAYCFVFLYVVFAGAGPWSLDAVLRKRS